jgi:hypothetical protein
MTRKDYIESAKILNTYAEYIKVRSSEEHYNNMVQDFCAMYKKDNINFDEQKFLDAVYKPKYKPKSGIMYLGKIIGSN